MNDRHEPRLTDTIATGRYAYLAHPTGTLRFTDDLEVAASHWHSVVKPGERVAATLPLQEPYTMVLPTALDAHNARVRERRADRREMFGHGVILGFVIGFLAALPVWMPL